MLLTVINMISVLDVGDFCIYININLQLVANISHRTHLKKIIYELIMLFDLVLHLKIPVDSLYFYNCIIIVVVVVVIITICTNMKHY